MTALALENMTDLDQNLILQVDMLAKEKGISFEEMIKILLGFYQNYRFSQAKKSENEGFYEGIMKWRNEHTDSLLSEGEFNQYFNQPQADYGKPPFWSDWTDEDWEQFDVST